MMNKNDEEEDEGEEEVILKYDPFILKLIYSKLYYWDHISTIYFKCLAPHSLSITKPVSQREDDMILMEFLIEKEYHIQCIKHDIDQLDRLVNDEKNAKTLGRFKFDLFYANFEFCLYRLWIISNCHSDHPLHNDLVDYEKKNILKDFDDSQFCCEMIISQNVNNKDKMNDLDRKLYNSFLERYIKDFYFNPLGFNAKRVKSRVKLFLLTKVAVENALFKKYGNNDDNFMIHHTKESIMAIMLIYFIDEFIHYMRHDTRYSLISKSDSKTYDMYDPHLGTSTTTNKTEDERMIVFLNHLKGEILDACLSRLHTLADSSPNEIVSINTNTSTSSSSSTSFWDIFGSKSNTEEPIITQYQTLKLNEEDDSVNDLSNLLQDYEDEFEKESFYYTYQQKIVPKRTNTIGTKIDWTKPFITKKDENAYKEFIQVKEKNGLKHYIDFIGLNDTYYDNIIRVFLFDIRIAKNHYCKKELAGKNLNYTHPPSTHTPSSSSSLSRPIFLCSICRYEFTHSDYQEFYCNMNQLSYNKKFSFSSSNVSKTSIFRFDLSKRLFRTNFDIVQSTEGFIYKTLYLSYFIPYHTSIISKEYMKNLAITKHLSSIIGHSGSSSGGCDPYTVVSHYENFLSFINIDNCIRSIQEDIVHNTESRITSIMKECQRMSKSQNTSFDSIVIGASLLMDNNEKDNEEPLTVNEITLRLATEILFLLLFIKAVSDEQLKNERRERSNNVSPRSLNSVKTNNDIITCLNTIYCYYMVILSSKMKKT